MAKKYVQGIDKIIIDKVDIVDFLSQYMQLKKSGRNYKGLCPFHNEKTPSFFVSTEEQLYNCFGCEAGGNVINFVSDIENLDFLDTIEFIADRINLDLDDYIQDSEGYSEKYKERDNIIKLNREAAIYFYRNLQKNTQALEYLKNRNINKKIIKTFGLGYSLDRWEGLKNHLKSKGYTKEFLYKAGLVSESKDRYYDKFRKRIIFPIFDVKGKIIAFGGRIIENDTKAPKYLNSPETMVFNKSEVLYGLNIARKNIRNDKKLILVEGYMDVIMLNKYDVKNAVATLGTSFTKSHAKIIKKYVNELIICFDSDIAGLKATKRAINNSKGILEKVSIIELPKGNDPDDFINENGKDEFINKIDNAKPSHLFLLDKLEEKLDLTKEYDLKEFMQESKKILKDIKEYSIRSYYGKIISEKINLPIENILDEIFDTPSRLKSYNNRSNNIKRQKNKKLKENNLQKIEKKMLQFALSDKKHYNFLVKNFDVNKFSLKSVSNIFKYLESYYEKSSEFHISEALDYLEIKESKLCEELIRDTSLSSNAERDIKIYIKKIEIELLQNELTELKYSRNSISENQDLEKIIIKEEALKREIKDKKAKFNS